MAKLQIDVEVMNKKIAGQFQDIKSKGGFKERAVDEKKAESLIQQLAEFEKHIPTTKEGIKTLVSSYRQLLDILEASAAVIDKLSPEIQKLTADLKEQKRAFNTILDKASDYAKSGKQYINGEEFGVIRKAFQGHSFNKDSFEMTDAELKRQLIKANIRDSKGKQITYSYSSFLKNREKGNIHPDDRKKAEQLFKEYGNAEQIGTKIKEWRNELEKFYQEFLAIEKKINISENKLEKEKGKAPYTANITGTRKDLEIAYNKQKELNEAEKASIETTNALTSKIQKQQTTLGKAFKQFTIYTFAIRAVKKAAQEAVKTIAELDKSLTEQAMVTGLTREQTYKLIGSYQELALQTGATTKEVAEVASEYMKQGHTVADSITLTRAAISAAKVARVSVGDSINYLTTALNGFRLSAEDAMLVSDKFAAVAAASATDYDELAIALSKVASQANLAGMSIDYTTALLTKGLETTREAPETMGTALKTIIARMRELTDYGRTLDDGMDVNNVESQLAYVGIALRNTNGELRSTEDVLDELGKKWDTLNTNQQAALAKALAGTRQQSRLIALMDGYERVTELQQISLDSAGATAAQADVYLQGIEASLNKINVAWEKIITGLTNSELITWLFDQIANALENINNIVSTTGGQIGLITAIGVAVSGIVAQKIIENDLARKQLKLSNQLLVNKNKELILEKQKTQEERKQTLLAEKGYHSKTLKNGETKWYKGKKKASLFEIDNLLAQDKQYADASAAIMKATNENLLLEKNKSLGLFKSAFGVINEHFDGMIGKIPGISKLTSALGIIPGIGTKIALAMGVAGAAIGGIYLLTKKFSTSIQDTSDRVKKISNEIFTLSKKQTELDTLLKKYNTINDKTIQNNADLKEKNKLLESAVDLLNEEEQAEYNSLISSKAKTEYLTTVYKKREEELEKKQQDRLREIQRLSKADLKKALTGNATEDLIIQDAVLASASTAFVKYTNEIIDLTEEERLAFKTLGHEILNNVDYLELMNYTSEEGAKRLIEQIKKAGLVTTTTGEQSQAFEVLTSDDALIVDRVKAYNQIFAGLDKQSQEAFAKAYNDIKDLAELNSKSLSIINELGWTNEDINKLTDSWKKIKKAGVNIDKKTFEEKVLSQLLPRLGSGENIQTILEDVFSAELGSFTKDSEEYNKAYNAFLNSYGNLVEKPILDIGQQTEKVMNTIGNIYSKAGKWNELSESDKTKFINDNPDLFAGSSGANLLEAFNSGNYVAIEKALSENEGLRKRIKELEKDVDRALEVELAKTEDARDYGYIKYLEEKKKWLEDKTNIYKVSLKEQLELENKQLNEYKKLLEKQKKTLVDSLNKRKEAYQKYFQDIERSEQLEDYEQRKADLEEKILRISSSGDSNSLESRRELEKELAALEKDHAKDARKQAQELMVQAIDQNLDDINKKFDEVLQNQKLLLETMKKDFGSNGSLVIDKMLMAAKKDMTDMQYRDFVNNFQRIFSPIVPAYDWEAAQNTTNQNNMYLNVNNKNVQLSDNEAQKLIDYIIKALAGKGGM